MSTAVTAAAAAAAAAINENVPRETNDANKRVVAKTITDFTSDETFICG